MLALWKEVKKIEHLSDIMQEYSVSPLVADHIPSISVAFNQVGWNKPVSLFAGYVKEIEQGERLVWVAFVHQQFAGYITLKWRSAYPFFKEQNIPEIMDLNVLPSFRKMGIGSLLLDTAEKEAATRSKVVGIGVGLYAGEDGGYGAAQRLYVKRGYVPDGKGVTYSYQSTIPGNGYLLDDELVLWFTKKLRFY
jgi:GNAT superfamily N-acetyltransferase